MRVIAYVYSGDWVADCVRPDCMGTEFLHDLRVPGLPAGADNPRDQRKTLFLCSNCRQMAEIEWPPEDFKRGVDLVLSSRPVPTTRNWYPLDHPGAVKLRVVHGETLEDLRQENIDHGVPV